MIHAVLPRLLFVMVFTGGYVLLTRDLHPKLLPSLILAGTLLLTYLVNQSSFAWSMIRYLLFVLIYLGWSLLFLNIKPRYALYLSVFFVILMGVWLGCIQVLFELIGIHHTALLILCTGLCRLLSVVLLRRYCIEISPDRDITVSEILLSLFPAATCFISNQVLFEFVNLSKDSLPPHWRLPISLLVLFFGASAMLVLIHSELFFKLNRLQTESELASRQLEEQYRLFRQETENNERIRALRHDIQNHLHTIEKMAATNPDQLQQYVNDIHFAAAQTENILSTGNPTLDALLSTKAELLTERNIRLKCYVNLAGVTVFSPMEICTLFGNALDNAIEAVSEEAISDKFIHLSGGITHHHLVVKIENPYAHPLHPENHRFSSTKQLNRPHGYGLLNIEKVLQSHDGTVTYNTEHQVFSMVWMVPLA